jgi:hypothetical protein
MNPIECAKCGHLNPHGGHKCEECHHHLYIVCPSCGQRIPRIHRYAHRLQDLSACSVAAPAKRSDLVLGLVALGVGLAVIIGVLAWPSLIDMRKEALEQKAFELARQPFGKYDSVKWWLQYLAPLGAAAAGVTFILGAAWSSLIASRK